IRQPDARSARYSSSAVLPMPASPTSMSTRLLPARTSASRPSSASRSSRRPRSSVAIATAEATGERTRVTYRRENAVGSATLCGVVRGRDQELEVVDALLEAVRAGAGRALVVQGEPGIGKTALLDGLAARASDCRVMRAAGVEWEMELAYAGLQQLIS